MEAPSAAVVVEDWLCCKYWVFDEIFTGLVKHYRHLLKNTYRCDSICVVGFVLRFFSLLEVWLTSRLIEPSKFQDSQDAVGLRFDSPAPSPGDEDAAVPTQEDPITPDVKSPELVPNEVVQESPKVLPEGNMDVVPGEAVEPEGDKGEVAETPPIQQHHILDEMLTRVQQDLALGKVPGKGRKPKKDADAAPARGRGRNKGGKGKGRGKGAKAAKSKASKPATCRRLPLENVDPAEKFSLTKEPQLWEDSDEETPVSNPGGEASGSRPEAGAKAKPAKPGDVAPKRRGRKPKVESAGSAPKAEPKKRRAPKEKPAPKKSAKGKDKVQKVEDGDRKPHIPVFKTCTIVPYWSRNAIALKVQTGLTKSGWTQAWF